jgi:hypothetical protein
MGQSAAKNHEKRLTRCMQSFQQLQADIRHLNLHISGEFARPRTELEAAVEAGEGNEQNDPASSSSEPLVLMFRPFTKLTKKSAIPWLWKVNGNVIIVATLTPKSIADSVISAAAKASASGSPAVVASTVPFNAKYQSYTLTIKDFYHIYLYFCDHLKTLIALREQIMKIEQPEEYAAAQDARRQQVLDQQKAQRKATAGEDQCKAPGEEEEQKSESLPRVASLTLARSISSPQDCSICLSCPEEEGLGNELVVLPCLHAFCSQCIADWRTQSATCPLCRKELSEGPQADADEWILTSPDLVQLKAQYSKVLLTPFQYISARASFPPAENTRGVKTAGDVFSLAVGEVLDVFTPAMRKASQPGAGVGVGAAGAPPQPLQAPKPPQRASSEGVASSPAGSPAAGSPPPVATPVGSTSSSVASSPVKESDLAEAQAGERSS